MTFQIKGLERATFAPYFEMDDVRPSQHMARRVQVEASPGFPCRVSLRDAEVGEEVLLINF